MDLLTSNSTAIGTSNANDRNSTTVLIISISSCSLSILGSFVIFGSFMFIPEIRNSTRRLVTCLTAADLLTALGYLISAIAHFADTDTDIICKVQSGITTYSSLVSFYLTVGIAIHIFVTVVYRDGRTSTWKFFLVANIVSWIIPGVIVSIALQEDALGRDHAESIATGPWCWLKSNNKHYKNWMFLTGKGWEFLCYLLTTTLYVLLKLYVYLRHRFQPFAAIHESLREDDKNYLYVWFLLYLLRLWGSIRSIISLTGADKGGPGEQVSKVFMYLQAGGDPGQAFCNCILFCFLDGTVRSHIFTNCLNRTQIDENIIQEERRALLENGNHHRYVVDDVPGRREN